MNRQVIIDSINIRLSSGWQGDPTHLARQLAEQIQQQAAELQSGERLNLDLRGHFAGAGKRAAEQLGGELKKYLQGSRSRRRDR